MHTNIATTTILHRLRELASAIDSANRIAFVFLRDNGSEECRLSFSMLWNLVCAQAGIIRERSPESARILIALPPGLNYVVAFLACMLAERIPVPLYPFKQNSSRCRVEAVMQDTQAEYIFSNESLATDTRSDTAKSISFDNAKLEVLPGLSNGMSKLPELLVGELPEIDEVAFIQYTSGSTRQPRGVLVRHGSLMANLDDIRNAFAVSSDDIVVTWLPMFHDMGLIGSILGSIHSGVKCIHFPHTAFVQSPKLWLQSISRYGATISGGPNFAYDYCTKRIGETDESFALNTWRIAFCGAEPIRPRTLEGFVRHFSVNGFRRSALFPCYGLAEATLHVTGNLPGEVPWVLEVNQYGQPMNNAEPRAMGPWVLESRDRLVISCGSPPPDTRVAILDPKSREHLPDGEVGEIVVTGPGVASGYWNSADPANAVFTSISNKLSRLETQDLGFMWKGDLYVSGRIKDVIISYGRKYHAHDIEAAVEEADQVFAEHGCAALGMELHGSERLVVVAELKRTALRNFDLDSIVRHTRTALLSNEGPQLTALILVKPRSLPKTSSGKLQRQATKNMLLQGEIEPIASWTLLTSQQRPTWVTRLQYPVLATSEA